MSKLWEAKNYVIISGDTIRNPQPSSSVDREEELDFSEKGPAQQLYFFKKPLKLKAKNSDDKTTFSSAQCDEKEFDLSHESQNVLAKHETNGVTNLKKKYRQQVEHPESTKIMQTINKLKENKENDVRKNRDVAENFLTNSDNNPIVTLIENNDHILEEFDPLWVGNSKNEEKSCAQRISKNGNKPLISLPTKNKVNNEKVMLSENMAPIKIPKLKTAKLEAIQEILVEEKVAEEVKKDVKDKLLFAKAKVSYEGLEGLFAKLVINDHSDAVKEDALSDAAASNEFASDLSKDSASSSFPEVLPVFVQPRKNPWNVWPGLYNDGLRVPTEIPLAEMEADSKKTINDWLAGSKPVDQSRIFAGTDQEEKEANKKIADFFAEEARALNEQDINKYSTNIEISKIEIYEEDIKRYHQSLKYHRGPVDHDIIFTTVETALNFVQTLVKEREQKNKISFLPELLGQCLKGKVQREMEKEEERKKMEKEKNKKKGMLPPKMWLVFNRLSKEKVVICTPGEFYDSD